MQWIRHFQLFLFDFDGLLVNSEHLHFQAYIDTLAKHEKKLDWSFARFCEAAHVNATALREAIYAEFPDLDVDWESFYAEKKRSYLELLSSGRVELMPGVDKLLKELSAIGKRRCVVTNSFAEQTQLIATKIPVLRSIPHWITREMYSKPKPDPEGYLKAIQLFGEKGDRIIGFEDTLRGLQALKQTPAFSVLVCPSHYPLIEIATEGAMLHVESIAALLERDTLES